MHLSGEVSSDSMPGYHIHVILTPVSDRWIPFEAFKDLPDEQRNDVGSWLGANGFRIDSIRAYAETVTLRNTSYIRSLDMDVGQWIYPLIASRVLKRVELAMSKPWKIILGGTEYHYAARFGGH